MADNGQSEITPKKLWAAILVAVLGGNFTGLLNSVSPSVRYDAITGTEARKVHDELRAELHRIDRIQYLMDLRMRQRERSDEKAHELIRQLEMKVP